MVKNHKNKDKNKGKNQQNKSYKVSADNYRAALLSFFSLVTIYVLCIIKQFGQ